MTAPVLHLRHGAQIVVMVMYVPTLIAAAAGVSYAMLRGERAMRYRLHLQAWQLRQLRG